MLRYRLYVVICGGFLINICLGSFYTFGNISPYMISYLRNRTSEYSRRNVDSMWILIGGNIVSPVGMLLGGIINKYLKVRLATTIGCALFCLGTFATYYAIQKSLVGVVLTYGAMAQFGLTIAYGPLAQCASRLCNWDLFQWIPKRQSFAVGLMVCGFGAGALIFNQVVTAFVNPENLTPDQTTSDGQKYFTEKRVLDRVPDLFLLLSGMFTACQVIGILAITDAPPEVHTPRNLNEIEVAVNLPSHLKCNIRATLPVKQLLGKMFRNKNSYIILAYAFLVNGGMSFAIGLYKAYGQTFISDDHFLALVGSISSIFNSLFRPIWGTVMDKFGFQIAMKVSSALFVCLSCTLLLTEHITKAGFMIWICGLYASFCVIFATVPATLGKLFGNENMAICMGPYFFAIAAGSLTSSFVGINLETALGWHGLFLLAGFMVAVAFLLTFLFDGKDINGNPF